MKSKRSTEGYLLIDHRNSPGVSDAAVWHCDLPPGAGQGLFEAATYTCSHCLYVVVIEPKRTRDRAHCMGCHHDICDACGVIYAKTLACSSFKRKAESVLEAAAQIVNIKEL